MGGIILTFALVVAAIGYGLYALLLNWMSQGPAALGAIVIVLAVLAYIVSRIRRRIRNIVANPSLAGLVRSGGTAAVLALVMRNPRLLFTLGSMYAAMKRNQRPR